MADELDYEPDEDDNDSSDSYSTTTNKVNESQLTEVWDDAQDSSDDDCSTQGVKIAIGPISQPIVPDGDIERKPSILVPQTPDEELFPVTFDKQTSPSYVVEPSVREISKGTEKDDNTGGVENEHIRNLFTNPKNQEVAFARVMMNRNDPIVGRIFERKVNCVECPFEVIHKCFKNGRNISLLPIRTKLFKCYGCNFYIHHDKCLPPQENKFEQICRLISCDSCVFNSSHACPPVTCAESPIKYLIPQEFLDSSRHVWNCRCGNTFLHKNCNRTTYNDSFFIETIYCQRKDTKIIHVIIDNKQILRSHVQKFVLFVLFLKLVFLIE